ncbi:Helix-turn-helix domain-containing protein [Variovorax sp. NFACC28]|nr:Helix-turn-helix domain-containing protein [Variovorax sp. NFACC28]SEF72495.1 Helix-turn-helix domain-containing protein [Variovorax sp. NFACC29]SFB77258.1 Helix-turn-helix domain-containing protein [Variovorax sp. NFACC26]SFG76865.1 Helix-turn-helix domain-containing protein [Variovorax sp. NFACC27]
MEATVENLIAWGVRVNREAQNLTQAQLAARMGTQQSAVSKLEDTEGGDVQLSKLVKAAHALDLALFVKFVSYPEFARLTRDVGTPALTAEPFAETICRATGVSKG